MRSPLFRCIPFTLGAALIASAPLARGEVPADGWTTIGSRSGVSRPGTVISSNAAATWTTYAPPARYPRVVNETNHFLTMDDGVVLAANVGRPADADGQVVERRLPAIVTLTTYNKDFGAYVPTLGGAHPTFVSHGYVHVNVDVRGTGRSGGQWEAFSAREQKDYDQVIAWVASQPWSNGRIGLHGTSALAITSMLTAAQGNPAVKAVFPIVPMGDAYRDVVAVGGQGSFGFLTGWLGFVTALGVINPSFYESPEQYLAAVAEHAYSALANFQVPTLLQGLGGQPDVINDGPFWKLRSPLAHAQRVRVPVFIVGGLHDVFQRGEPLLYETLKTRTTAKLLMGPWDHLEASLGAGLPTDGVPKLDAIALMWFDRYVKGIENGAENLPNVTRWFWGADRYVTTTDWPHPKAKARRWYLGGDGSLSPQIPAEGAAPRLTLQEPVNGLCSQSATQATLGILGLTQLPCYTTDNFVNALEIVYETEPLARDLVLDGPIQADLWVSTTAQDAGLVVRVADVAPNGAAFNLSNGMLQLSQRAVDPEKSRYLDGQMIQPWHPFTAASKQAVERGPVAASVEVWQTSALIRKGHRLRVSVGPSNFPAGLPA
ncbi:MAG TPA: CocE/NonD family hydrolase, partial [Nevskiaceae bacterium]|nr:CocE/NonD family hydrolase [Nevskiaceae bacterium]